MLVLLGALHSSLSTVVSVLGSALSALSSQSFCELNWEGLGRCGLVGEGAPQPAPSSVSLSACPGIKLTAAASAPCLPASSHDDQGLTSWECKRDR